MKKERFTLHVCVYLVIRNANDEVLLLLRQNTGYEDGKYSLVAGHADGNETICQAVAREALEESGIHIRPENLHHVHTMHRVSNRENIDLFFTCDRWEGLITNTEPDKCAELAFYPVANLPTNTLGYIRQAFDMIEQGITYSEYGWK